MPLRRWRGTVTRFPGSSRQARRWLKRDTVPAGGIGEPPLFRTWGASTSTTESNRRPRVSTKPAAATSHTAIQLLLMIAAATADRVASHTARRTMPTITTGTIHVAVFGTRNDGKSARPSAAKRRDNASASQYPPSPGLTE